MVAAVLSPDGRSVAFLARQEGIQRLWVRPLNDFVAHPLAGTEDAYSTFWSPDSRNLGFVSQGKLKRVPAAGGPALTLCDLEQVRGGSWNSQDVIIFAKYPGEIYRVPATGGTPQKVTTLDSSRHDTTHRWPYFLPDGNHFLYMASVFGSANEDNVFFVGSLDGNVNRILFHGSSNIAYGDGHLVYTVDKTLMARPFDTREAGVHRRCGSRRRKRAVRPHFQRRRLLGFAKWRANLPDGQCVELTVRGPVQPGRQAAGELQPREG